MAQSILMMDDLGWIKMLFAAMLRKSWMAASAPRLIPANIRLTLRTNGIICKFYFKNNTNIPEIPNKHPLNVFLTISKDSAIFGRCTGFGTSSG